MGPPFTDRHFEPDAALYRRMFLTMALVAGVYAAAVLPFFLTGGPLWGLAAVAAAVALAVVQCRWADRFVLWATGAREVTAAAEPELHALVDRLCVSAGLPRPRVAVAATPVPNAFAAGSGPGSAIVCVTDGLRDVLGPAELNAVLGHEIAHIRNRDVLIAGIAVFPCLCADLFLGFWTGLLRPRGPLGPFGALPAVPLLPLAVAAAALYAAGLVTSMALSRHRELCADATGALLTGRPTDLATALGRIDGEVRDAGAADRRALRPVSGLCVVPVRGRRRDAAGLLSSHPTLARRVARLTWVSRRLAAGGR
ncbi:M48 family metalloprotease [Actinomadura kijaniata]|uniref:M48 family metalloprotease n=1 Tax=Actinomadura kijaniata TaxID=46161 RepID=UPI003F1B3396